MSMNRLRFSENIIGGFSNKEAFGEFPNPLPETLKLNLGCGTDVKPGWINIDLFSNDPSVVKMDIRKLEIPDGVVDEILASDVLEHFSHREVDLVLKEWARVLKPSGSITIRCPNLKLQMEAYLRGDWDADIASYMIFGGQTNPGDYHCVGFDRISIEKHLNRAGFYIISYTEHNFPQDKNKINLNMSVTAAKFSAQNNHQEINKNTSKYGDDPYSGLDFTLDDEANKSHDQAKQNETIEDTLEYSEPDIDAEDELFDVDMLREIISIDSKTLEVKKQRKQMNIVWEGSQFVYHSLALINREHCLNILKSDKAELTIVPYEADAFHHSVDPRFEKLIENDVRFKNSSDESIKNLPYVWIRHQWPPNTEPPKGAKWIIMQPWEYSHLLEEFVEAFKKADEVWTPSNFSRQAFINSGIDPEKVQVIPNGINPDIFKPFGEKYDIGTEKKMKFLYVGGTIFRKGIDILLKAYTNMFSAKDDVTLIIKDIGGKSFYSGQTSSDIIKRIQREPNAPEIIYIDADLNETEVAEV